MSTQMTIEFPNDRPVLLLVRGIAAGLATALLAALIIGGDYTTRDAAPATPSPPRAVGVFTGNYADGVPVYRMPPVDITGSRGANPAARAPTTLDRHGENVTLGPFHANHPMLPLPT
jgi:hypothetical protein